MTQAQYIVGVDEVGRGPLAGPVAVCAATVKSDFDFSVFPFLNDSKKLSEKRREKIFEQALDLQAAGGLRFAVQFQGADVIDVDGIETAIRRALEGALAGLAVAEAGTHVFLDGRLKAPKQFSQETVIGGDATIPIISLASVLAKVSRDRLMVEYCAAYPQYRFSEHKGYGTAAHIAAIREHGVSPLHRRTFLSRIAPDA